MERDTNIQRMPRVTCLWKRMMPFDKLHPRNNCPVESGPNGECEVDWRLPYHLRSAVQRPSVLEYVEPG